MPKGRTGYEILKGWVTGKKPVPVEQQFHNPLDVKIGSHARFNNVVVTYRNEPDVDLTDELFRVTGIWAWDRKINSTPHPFTDYILETDDKKIVLRVFQTVSRGKAGDFEFLVMSHYWPDNSDEPYGWGPESPFVLDGMCDPTGEFVRFGGTPEEEKYFRDLNNISCNVAIITDANRDGTVELEEVQKQVFSLWTFRRDTQDHHDQKFTQHLHVQLSGVYNPDARREADKVTGGDKDILILRGESVSQMSVTLY
jgi:hypothetical protein